MLGSFNLGRGFKLYNTGDYIGALEKLNKAVQSGDLDYEEMYNAHVAAGACFIEIGNYDEAIKVLECALEYKNGDYFAFYKFGEAFFRKKNYELALEYSDKALKLNSNDSGAWLLKGWSLFNLDRYDDALKVLNEALTCTPSMESKSIDSINQDIFMMRLTKSYNDGAKLLFDEKNEEALIVYDTLIKEINQNSVTELTENVKDILADSLMSKGLSLNRLEKYDSAINAYEKAIDLNPNKPVMYIGLADCFVELNQFDKASENYAKAEKIYTEEYDKKDVILRKHDLIIGKLLRNKDYQAALDYMLSIPEKDETLICYKNMYTGKILFYFEKYDEALKYLLPYIDGKQIDSVFSDRTGRIMVNTYAGGVYYKQKDYETALKYLTKCTGIGYNAFADTWALIGECYIELSEYEKAVDSLQKALDTWDKSTTKFYDKSYLESRIKFAKEKSEEGIQKEENGIICSNCGNKVGTNDLFCRKCGSKLK